MTIFSYRGVSSVVRLCVEKETGKEFAAKIIDISSDDEGQNSFTLYQASQREIAILRMVAGHHYISQCLDVSIVLFIKIIFFTVKLYDVFESSTYIFLVFEL